MKNKTKPHKAKGKTSSKSKKGLSGAEKFASVSKKMTGAVRPLGVIGGLALSSLAGWGIDKIKFLAPDETAGTKFQIKSLVKPAILATLGIGTALMSSGKGKSEKPTWQFVNGLGWGFIAGSTFVVGKVILKKDLFGGLKGTDDELTKALNASDEYRKQAEDAARLLEQNKFRVELPAPARSEMAGFNGNVNSEMNETDMIL